MRLNHVSNRVVTGSLGLLIELFTDQLNFQVLRLTETDVWMRQEDSNVDIQFCETDAPIAQGDKHNSHISLLSDTPKESLEELEKWLQSKGVTTKTGSWSEKEFWLDAPEVFVDFALESMTPDLADYS